MNSLKLLKLVSLVLAMGLSPLKFATAQDKEQPSEPSLIDAYFMEDAIVSASLSPDGKELLVVRSVTKEGPRVAYVLKTNNLAGEPQTFGSGKLEFRSAFWAGNGKLFISMRDIIKRGENTRVRGQAALVNSDGKGAWKVLANQGEVINLFNSLPNDPKYALVSYNKLTREGSVTSAPDIMKLNLKNGRKTLVMKGSDRLRPLRILDADGDIRLAQGYDGNAIALTFHVRVKGESEWKQIYSWQAADKKLWEPLGFVKGEPNQLYVRAHMDQDTMGIYKLDLTTMEYSDRIFGLKSVDAGQFLRAGERKRYGELVGFTYEHSNTKRRWIDEEYEAFYAQLEATFPGKVVSVASRSDDNSKMVIVSTSAKDPGSYYLYDAKKGIEFIGSRLPFVKEEDGGEQKFVKYTTRDGKKLYAYITLPKKGKKPYPTVVMPHGGPWARDYGGFNGWSQYFTRLGYMVIRPQYRGSEGFGLEHWRVADGQWGLMMQDDIDDAAFWAFDKGLADRNKTIIHGYSFGGYAALVGSFREGGPWQCAISGAPVANMQTWQNVTNGSSFGRQRQKAALDGLSPVEHADEVRMPLLLMHGKDDFNNSARDHSRPMSDKLTSAGKKHIYHEFEGMGHQNVYWTYQNKVDYWTAVTDFLQNDCWGDDNRPVAAR